jgi:ankyrin repeat protein
MIIRTFLNYLLHSRISHLATVLLIMSACCIPAFCQQDLDKEIHYSAHKGDLPKVQSLLKNNPELVSSKDEYGDTPLHVAGNRAVAELLLAEGAEVNARDNNAWTPLHWAADAGNKDVVELLLANKAEVNAKNKDGKTSLHMAVVRSSNKAVAELLLSNGAEANAKNNDGNTPLHCAVDGGNNKDMVELLLVNKADVNVRNNDGKTPLCLAVKKLLLLL